jgi:hypothetical protein
MKKCVFDKVAQFVEILVVFALDNAILFGRDNWLHALHFCLLDNRIRIVPTIGQQMRCRDAVDQL